MTISAHVQELGRQIIEAGFVEEAQAAIKMLQAKEDAQKGAGHMLPPNVLAEFHALRGGGDQHQWLIGQRVEIAAVEYAGRIPLQRIWKEAASEIECSRGQIRKCHETWQGTDDEMRETYDVLTFQHFATVVAYCRDRSERVKWLKWCVDSADDFAGKPAPAAVLEKKLKTAPPEPPYSQLILRALAAIERARDAADCPAGKRDKLAAVLEGLERMA